MSLLTIAQNVCDMIAIQRPSSIVGSSNETARRCLALATKECKALAKRHPWSALAREHSISTVAATESYALPSDFDRYLDDAAWDATNYWKIRGSLSGSEWQWAKRSIVATATNRKRFRIKWDTSSSARRIFIDPVPTAVESLIVEYISTHFCQSAGGSGQAAWAADTDTGRIDEDLIELGLRWRLLNALGQPYAEERDEYDKRLVRMIGQDAPARVLNLAGERIGEFVNVQDGNYGL